MKKSGIVRRLDDLGRVVPPMEMRRALDIEDRDALEFTLEGDAIVIRKYTPSCVFCFSGEEFVEFKGRRICRRCLDELQKQS